MIQSQILTVEAHRLRISSPEFPNISVGDITWLNGLPRAAAVSRVLSESGLESQHWRKVSGRLETGD